MNRSIILAAFAMIAAPAALSGQAAAERGTTRTAPSAAGAALTGLRTNWRNLANYINTAAVEATEKEYAYRPVATVRTFGEIIGHVAGSQFMFCAIALGDPPRAEDAIEKKAKTKAELVQALKESTDYCEKAYRQDPALMAQAGTMFGQPATRGDALAINATHDGEHYGNIITYMRMQGKIPPSSR